DSSDCDTAAPFDSPVAVIPDVSQLASNVTFQVTSSESWPVIDTVVPCEVKSSPSTDHRPPNSATQGTNEADGTLCATRSLTELVGQAVPGTTLASLVSLCIAEMAPMTATAISTSTASAVTFLTAASPHAVSSPARP